MNPDTDSLLREVPDVAVDAPDDGLAVAPWWKSQRTWIAAAIVLAFVGEAAWAARRDDPYAERRRELAALDDAHKAELMDRFERFRKLDSAEQQRLRDLDSAIEADADPASLRETLAAYEQWKAHLTPVQSAELVGLSSQARVDRLRALAAEQTALASRTLTPDDAKAIITWLERQVKQNQQKLLEALPESARERFEVMDDRERNWSLMLFVLTPRSPDAPSRLENLTPQALNELRSHLSPALQHQWDTAATQEDRKLLIADWVKQAIARQFMPRQSTGPIARVDEKELRKFFDEDLNDVERRRFLSMSGEEMTYQLRREYLRRKGLWRDPGMGEGSFGRSPFMRQPGAMGDRRPGQPGLERRPGNGPGAPSQPPKKDDAR